MLRKHLSQYNGEELRAEIKRHVDEQIQENKKLDYKETVSLDERGARREAAKDISSFANEIGGCVVYGVPEKKMTLPDDTKIVVPKKPYGMEAISGFEERFEDTCAETICPHLLDLQIRKVETEYDDKVVYVVWHPGSWMAPHMVQAYNDHSYYKRGLRRAIKMSEHEVRQKYLEVQGRLDRVSQFIESPEVNFYADASDDAITHAVCSPMMLVPDRVDFSTASMGEWLGSDSTQGFVRPHRWRASYYGVCAGPVWYGQTGGQEIYCELHRNGAANYCCPTLVVPREGEDECEFVETLHLLRKLKEFLSFCGAFYHELGYYGPVAIRVRLTRCSDTGFFFMRTGWCYPQDPVTISGLRNRDYLQVDLEASAAELVEKPESVLKSCADRLYQTFGRDEADCFDSDLSFRTEWPG